MSDNKQDAHNSLLSAANCDKLKKVKKLLICHGLSYFPDLLGEGSLLLKATFFGYKKLVKNFLKKDAKVSYGTDTPLLFATWFGDAELVELLLDYKNLINREDKQGETPLHIACQRGHTNVVRLLLDKGANANAKRRCPAIYSKKFDHIIIDQTAFASACRGGHKGFKEILDYGAKVYDDRKRLSLLPEIDASDIPANLVHRKSENESHVTPLHLAAEMGYLEIVELLLSHHARVDSKTCRDLTPLFLAAANGHKDVAELLLEGGACVDTNDGDFAELLFEHCACVDTNDDDVAELLLEHGACVDANDGNSTSPLYFAVERRWTKMVECLLERGASFDELTKTVFAKMVECFLDGGAVIDDTNPGFSPLHLAVGSGLKEVVVLFLKAGYDANAKDQFGNPPISYSMNRDVKGEHAETIQLLLDHGANLKEAPNLLHKAVSKHNFNACDVLIKNRADVNALGNNNMKVSPGDLKPVHQVVPMYQDKKAQYLETGKLAILKPDADELTPLHLACLYGCSKIVELLLNSGANTEARQVNGLTPLHVAAMNGNEDIVKLLVKYNAELDARGPSNETALHYGVMRNKSEVVLILLDNGCDLNMESIDGKTAFELAGQSPLDPRAPFAAYRVKSFENYYHKLIMNHFKSHLVMREVAGIFVAKRMLHLVHLESEFDARQQIYEEEVARMKGEVLLDKYTLHDVLMKRRNPIHMRNESLVSTLETFDYCKYQVYGKLLQSAFKKNKERIKLLDSGREWLRILMKISNTLNVETVPIPAWPELEQIVSYLNKEDWLSLISCGENLKRQLCQ